MSVHYTDDTVTLHAGDCLDVLATLPDASVDAVITDPPYDLTANKKGGTGAASVNLDSPYGRGRARIGTGNGSGGFMGKAWDSTGIAFRPEVWVECLRVLKPGGHLLAFGGTRTSHRLACAVEDAGFEIRDSIAWLYGSGFPKSLDVSKAIDKAAGVERAVLSEGATVKRMIPGADQDRTGSWIKDNGREFTPTVTAPATPDAHQWQGWGTALKPAHEPIVVARKPLVGTVAANVLAHGTGALNLRTRGEGGNYDGTKDRWPANVVLDESQAEALDLMSGDRPGMRSQRDFKETPSGYFGADKHPGEREGFNDTGGASRFFYVAKAPARERPRVDDVAHPTVKPLALMRWLVRLVTPPGGVVLEPFAGSGATVEACILESFRCVAIERETDYLPLILARIERQREAAASVEPTLFDGEAS